ncbi:MAG TPA: hypothetical protein VF598_02835, partial [Hymenobacter sp.]
ASFLQHTADNEKTTVHTRATNGRGAQQYDALLIAQTKSQKLFITLERKRRYVTFTQLEDSDDIELDFLQDYAEVEAIMEDAGLDGIHDGERGILYHNLLFLLMNP